MLTPFTVTLNLLSFASSPPPPLLTFAWPPPPPPLDPGEHPRPPARLYPGDRAQPRYTTPSRTTLTQPLDLTYAHTTHLPDR